MDLLSSSVFFVVLFASFIQSITGFGFAVVGAPLLLFFMEPREVVSLMILGALILNLMVIYKTREAADYKVVWPMFFASLIGIIPGVYILRIVDSSVLKMTIGIVILLVSVVMAGNYVFTIRRQRLATVIVGVISGFMGGSTSLSGPPVALFLMNQQQDKDVFRANLVRYFCLGNVATLVVMYYMGTLDMGIIRQGTYIIPGILLGVWFGEKAFAKISPHTFRWLSLAVVFLCGAVSVGSEIMKGSH